MLLAKPSCAWRPVCARRGAPAAASLRIHRFHQHRRRGVRVEVGTEGGEQVASWREYDDACEVRVLDEGRCAVGC
jgi:hypothetical protein